MNLEAEAVSRRMFSWVDIDENLARLAEQGEWPAWLWEVSSFWDSVELTVLGSVALQEVRAWLTDTFGPGYVVGSDTELELLLDDPSEGNRPTLPIILRKESEEPGSRRLPVLRERRITSDLARPLPRPDSDTFCGGIQLLAFHSFKGGVGRTVHAVAMADRLAQQGRQVLLIDGDLEAPGITAMHKAQGGRRDFSYEDLLALLHASEDGSSTYAVTTAAAYLPNQEAGHYLGSGAVFVLPASRRDGFTPPRIEPTDLLTPSRSRYFLSEAIAELGHRLEVDVVVIDLRAGVSELSAPLLLDPRVQRVFVTTLSSQSLEGTAGLVRQLGRRAPSLRGCDPVSSVVITQYRNDVHGTQADEARRLITAAIQDCVGVAQATATQDTDPVDAEVLAAPVFSQFRDELLALPAHWDAVVDIIRRLNLGDLLAEIVPDVLGPEAPASETSTEPAEELRSRRQRLHDQAEALVYAERAGLTPASGLLLTEPLRRLVGDHRTEPPITVVIGAKGAGKTFTYAKLCAAGSWSTFAEESGLSGVTVAAPVVPALAPEAIEVDAIQRLRDDFAGGARSSSSLDIKEVIEGGLSTLDPTDSIAWRRLWLRCLAMAAGVYHDGGEAEEILTKLGASRQAVFVIDGLEDLLQDLDSESKRTALRVLLTNVPAWLRSLRGRPLGLVVFVRKDLVQRAIRQNSEQLIDRYSPYGLRWDRPEALRLALWISVEAEVLPQPQVVLRDLSTGEVEENLIPLWGFKLGAEDSREARSHLWVPAALSDFNQQIQARDVVVFLREAAKHSIDDTYWHDRLLVPTAMRNALKECSRVKINAIKAEDQQMEAVLTRLEQQTATVPFLAEDLGLSAADVQLLTTAGALRRDEEGRYWMPEIYRNGLGFGTSRRARVLWS